MWKCNWEFVGEKCEHFFRRNVCVWFRVSSTFGQSDGACPTHRRQWADFLVSLMAPLHRQYKTARTETRCHLLLKIWQMAIQTSASRGYVLFRGAIKGHTQKSYKLSSGMRTWPAECSKLGKTRIIADANIRLVRNATFFELNFHLHFHLKSHGAVFS